MMTQIVNGVRTDIALCHHCAVDLGMDNPFSDIPSEIAKLIAQAAQESGADFENAPDLTCGECGLELKSFLESGLLGCPQCYLDFEDFLKTLLRRYHGTTRRLTSRKTGTPSPKIEEMNRLKGELERAIGLEDFEAAAKIRDRIKSLENSGS